MSQNKTGWYHSNGYNAQAACEYPSPRAVVSDSQSRCLLRAQNCFFFQLINHRRLDYSALARRPMEPLPHVKAALPTAGKTVVVKRVSRADSKPCFSSIGYSPVLFAGSARIPQTNHLTHHTKSGYFHQSRRPDG